MLVSSIQNPKSPRAKRISRQENPKSTAVGLSPGALHGDVLRGQDFVLQGEHATGGFVDLAREGDGALQNRLQSLFILNARRRVFVLDDQVRVGDIERQQFARRQLMIEPVDGAVL